MIYDKYIFVILLYRKMFLEGNVICIFSIFCCINLVNLCNIFGYILFLYIMIYILRYSFYFLFYNFCYYNYCCIGEYSLFYKIY